MANLGTLKCSILPPKYYPNLNWCLREMPAQGSFLSKHNLWVSPNYFRMSVCEANTHKTQISSHQYKQSIATVTSQSSFVVFAASFNFNLSLLNFPLPQHTCQSIVLHIVMLLVYHAELPVIVLNFPSICHTQFHLHLHYHSHANLVPDSF